MRKKFVMQKLFQYFRIGKGKITLHNIFIRQKEMLRKIF